jgi:hypothetical protein
MDVSCVMLYTILIRNKQDEPETTYSTTQPTENQEETLQEDRLCEEEWEDLPLRRHGSECYHTYNRKEIRHLQYLLFVF